VLAFQSMLLYMNMQMHVDEQISAVSESLRSGLSKDLSIVEDVVITCHRILHILQRDLQQFYDHVTHVSSDVRNYVTEQKERVTDDAKV